MNLNFNEICAFDIIIKLNKSTFELMVQAISNWFNKQIASIETAHNDVSWEESLDNAIASISAIKDLETEQGQDKL